ncbi:ankyrin repeat-containing domain protein [Xylaria bambusicola]|uniref:ankyrin repeat-containing domain protein n=1 Tax=Xylaria bambusicola TaxID=326684 RepID=UPI002008D376|nr:ankyrin repeat-containing domain protein [Xylaria bambusicola]KAI0515082.1 ankyrin repeat-containing domain protein [Xylaria bambusicola]
MGIAELPTELLDMIVDLLVPYRWTCHPVSNRDGFLDLRLVCRRFDYSVSYQALRKFELGSMPIDIEFSCIKWLLVTKLQASRGIETGLPAAVWGAVLSIEFWKAPGFEASIEKEYLDSACGLVIASRGTRWAGEEIDAKLKSRLHSPPPTMKPSGEETERLSPSHERALEAMDCFRSLHVASYHGDISVVRTLLDNSIDPNLSNEYFGSALYAACYRGHADIARLLIEHGAALDGEGSLGTPLEAATHLGHTTVVGLLLDKGAAFYPGRITTKCLLDASREGHTTVVGLLLDRGVTFYPGGITTKCLLDASREGHTEIVKLLLEQNDIKVNAIDHAGEPPLIIAAKRRHHGVARLLSARVDVNPNIEDNKWKTALHYACRYGSNDLVQCLLSRKDINPNPSWSEAPLLEAIKKNHNNVVQLLLACSRLDPNHSGEPNNTPLGYAINFDNKIVVQLLLERQDIDPNKLDDQRSPLCIAIQRESLDIIRLLLKRTDIDLNSTASISTPLWCAVNSGNDEIVELLLSQDGIDPSLRPHSYKAVHEFGYTDTLLQRAAKKGYVAILQRLLGYKILDPNENSKQGTPLGQAARYGQIEAMRLLLKSPEVDLNISSHFYIPNREEISLEHERFSQTDYDESKAATYKFSVLSDGPFGKETPLLAAVRAGGKLETRLLLQQPCIDTNLVDASGRSPLWWATCHGHNRFVEKLLHNPKTCPNIKDSKGWAPLLVAVYIGADSIVRILLKHPSIDPNTASDDGWTPLHIAANEGLELLVQNLLQHPDIKPDLALSDGTTALILAARKGYSSIVSLLAKY